MTILKKNKKKQSTCYIYENRGLSPIILFHNLIENPDSIEVEVEPKPDNVGYSRFRFIIKFKAPDKPDITKCYCLNDSGTWDLLFTG